MGDISLYLANELGFSALGKKQLDEIIVPAIEKIGYKVYEPFRENAKNYNFAQISSLEKYDERCEVLRESDSKTGRNNVIFMDCSKVMAAILDGSHAGDPGIGSEIGYYFPKRQPIVAVRTDFRLVENPAARINLQVKYFITHSPGGKLLFSYDEWYAELGKLYNKLKVQ